MKKIQYIAFFKMSRRSSEVITIDPLSIIKQGFIEKLGGIVHSWKNRYFVLHDNSLEYFKDQSLTEKLGSLPMIDVTLKYELPELEGPGFYFSLNFPEGSGTNRSRFLFRTPTDEERQDWYNTIKSVNKITIFGRPLSQALKVNPNHLNSYLSIPYFITSALQTIEEKYLDIEGIYRLNGSANAIDNLKETINKNGNPEYLTANDTTSLVKLYLRELPDPILQSKNFDLLRIICQNPTEENLPRSLREIISTLPIPNFLLLHKLFGHLRIILDHSETNKMNLKALSVCIGPSLIWKPPGTNDAMGENIVQQVFVETLLTKYDEIFGYPFFGYTSSGLISYCFLDNDLVESEYMLSGKKGDVVQVIADDQDDWTFCVLGDKWGAVPKNNLTQIKNPRELLMGLGKQDDKWRLSNDEYEKMIQKSPEANELYRILLDQNRNIRETVKKAVGL